MSRAERVLKKRFAVFCEGDTEYNYIDKMRKKQGVELVLKPINMHGGGYSNFLKQIKKESQTNYLAKFIIVDADRISADANERGNFQKLVNYCRLQNEKGNIPHFIIADNPDFEYVACLHDTAYKGQSSKSFIENVWGYKELSDFKKDANVYDFLNSGARSYQNMLLKIRNQEKLVANKYEIKKQRYDIVIRDTIINPGALNKKNSNIEEFFDIIDW